MRRSIPFGFLFLSTVLAQSLAAQLLRDDRKLHLPDVSLQRPLLLDTDRDGDLDAIVGGDQIRLLLNIGRLRFADISAQALPQLAAVPLAAADFDGDGDLDLLVSGPELLLNDRGTFTAASVGRLPALTNPWSAVATGDIDGDGDLDVFVAGQDQSWILRNSGAAVFTAVAIHPAAVRAVVACLGDVDGDRDLDLIVSTANSTSVLANDGNGQFAPIAGAVPSSSFTEIVLVDVDRDGDQDLVTGTVFSQPRQLFLNDGSGRFVDVTMSHLPATTAGFNRGIVAHDVDADGDPDLIVARNDYDSELLLNDGLGHFRTGDAGDLRNVRSPLLAAGDLDGDGTLDLLVHPTHVLMGRRHGAFALVDGCAIEADAESIVGAADFNGDGDIDLLQTLTSSNYVVKRNDGTGAFPRQGYSFLPAFPLANGAAMAIGDIDGDGDIDLLRSSLDLSPPGRAIGVARNDGAGNFAPPTRIAVSASNGNPLALFVDDVDGDGDADLLDVGSQGVLLSTNTGQGNFGAAMSIRFALITASELFDYDRDGDRDLFLAGSSLLLLENQRGTFVDVTAQRFATAPVGGVPRLGTVNGRTWLFVCGYQILVYEAGNSFVPRPDLAFTVRAPVTRVVQNAVPPSLDLVVSAASNGSGPSVRVLRFDEIVGFNDLTPHLLGDQRYDDVRPAGDLDGDGDVDWLGDRSPSDKRVLRAINRRMFAPFAAVVGADFEYRLADATAAATPTLLHLVLGTSLVRLPLPGLAVLRVDPATAVVLPPIAVRTANTFSVAFRIPLDVSLRDRTLVAQPFFVYLERASSVFGAAVREVVR